jgi:hypothetical protein
MEMYLGQCAQLGIKQAALYPVRQPRLPTSRRRSSPVKSTNRLPSSKPTNVRPNSQASWTAKLAVSLQPPALAQLGHGQRGFLAALLSQPPERCAGQCKSLATDFSTPCYCTAARQATDEIIDPPLGW